MRKKKTRAESNCESRKVIMPNDINPHGTLFGGVIMTWIDKIGYMCAQNYAECSNTVTASIDQIKFIRPTYLGDQVVLRGTVVQVGQSSMEIYVTLFKEHPESRIRELMGEAHMTFVALKKDGKKLIVPELLLENEDDYKYFNNSSTRLNYRKSLMKCLEENEVRNPDEHMKLNPSVAKRFINRFPSKILTKALSTLEAIRK